MPTETDAGTDTRRKVLVIDDSQMLLGFAKEVLSAANYEVLTAPSARDGLQVAAQNPPDLILLDYVLPDMKGVDVIARLAENGATARVPVIYMTGFGHRVQPAEISGNVIASLNKPFTSDLLKRTIAEHMPEKTTTAPAAVDTTTEETPAASFAPATIEEPHPPDAAGSIAETSDIAAVAGQTQEPWWTTPPPTLSEAEATPSISSPREERLPPETAPATSETAPAAETEATQEPFGGIVSETATAGVAPQPSDFAPSAVLESEAQAQPPWFAQPEPAPALHAEPLPVSERTFFSGDSTFFSLHWALQTIGKQRLTGTLRCFWDKAPVELLARNGELVLVTTRDTELYCAEAPITLVNVDAAQTAAARDQQRATSCPMFLTLAQQGLVLQETAMQLVEHYGEKLFSQLWSAARVRFVFELSDLPPFANDVPGEPDIDQWALGTLRFIQYQELRDTEPLDASCIPAYTKEGYQRVQRLRLTVAEAQFASQFNGVRSIAQIAKNLRLDIKFARLTLFRFLALEVVECWPPIAQVKQEKRGFFQRIGSVVGLSE